MLRRLGNVVHLWLETSCINDNSSIVGKGFGLLDELHEARPCQLFQKWAGGGGIAGRDIPLPAKGCHF